MSVPTNNARSPRGLTRRLYRLPIWLFRLHLGWLLGKRFLLLTHIGRKSGLPRQTVLEVLLYDREKERFIVFAGWGKQADWVKNVEHTPQVVIQVGGRSLRAHAIRLASMEAEAALLAYARAHPYLIRLLSRLLLGYRTNGTEDEVRTLARQKPIIAFETFPRRQVGDEHTPDDVATGSSPR
jgi:deazaflavin-dependent oxidoreductase (nitroreductase family)